MTVTAPPPPPAPTASPDDPGADGARPGQATGRMPRLLAATSAVAGGLLLDTAFPGVGAWPLALVAPALLLFAVRGRSAAGGFGMSVLFGLAFLVPHLYWIGTLVGALPWLALALLEAALLATVGLLWPACWRLAERRGWAWSLPLTTGAVWVAAEALRARAPFGGFPWARIAFSQADSPLVWLAPLGGAPGVGFAVVAVSASIALMTVRIIRLRGHGGGVRPIVVAAVPAVVAVVAVVVGVGVGQLAADTRRAGDTSITVAAIQGNVPRAGLDFNAERRAVTDNHAGVTRELAQRIDSGEVDPVDVVIWPENASDIDPLRSPDAEAVISAATDAIDAPVLVGAVLREPGDDLTNAILVWEPGTGYRGDADGRYAKQRPVPFAEYIPYRAFFRAITPLVDEVPRNFAPGPGPRVLTVGEAVIGPVICFEVADDVVVVNQVRAGATLLAVPTNNATFGFSDESTQQLAMTRFRAVEYGRTTVQASTVGVSAVVMPDGAMSRTTELFTADSLVAEVPLRSGLTPSAYLGQGPEWVVAILVAIAGVMLIGVRIGRARRR